MPTPVHESSNTIPKIDVIRPDEEGSPAHGSGIQHAFPTQSDSFLSTVRLRDNDVGAA